MQDNFNRKINLYHQQIFPDYTHRSGWNFAINSLKSLHNSQGILFDGFIERNFLWKHWKDGKRSAQIVEEMKQHPLSYQLLTSEEQGIIPYNQPWVGFLHNPQRMPTWFYYKCSPQMLFTKEVWKKSLEHCVGLFALSEYHAQWLRTQTGKPVSSLIHPTEIPELQFNSNRFLSNQYKKIIQVGWWLRKLSAIYQLPIPRDNILNYEKIRLVHTSSSHAAQKINDLMEKEVEGSYLDNNLIYLGNTTEMKRVSNSEYDCLLSENIVFVELYDSSANNVVVECIARATPLLINPLPAVVEYLGKEYPMYFTTLLEAAEKALDISLILDTHRYLKKCEIRENLSGDYFLKSLKQSEVYQLI